MKTASVTDGTVHTVPADLKRVLIADKSVLERWEDLTPLARNEWICWVITNKKPETRQNHINRTATELLAGRRRPCCWIGCVHRHDKAMSRSQKFILGR